MLTMCVQSSDPEMLAVLDSSVLAAPDGGSIATTTSQLLTTKLPLVQCAVTKLIAGLAPLDAKGVLGLAEGHIPGFLM
jgi:hypothetical protein